MAPAQTFWERLSHGFQLSGMVQAYSALPFNITSGVTTIQGTAGRPIVDGEFIDRNAGIGGYLLRAERQALARLRAWKRPRRGDRRGVQPHEPSE